MSTEQAAQLTKFQDMLSKMKPTRRISDIGPLPPPTAVTASIEKSPRRQSTGSTSTSTSTTNLKQSSTSNVKVTVKTKGEKRALPLKGQVILVDVRTAEGEEAGGVFMDMLRMMGARVSFTWACLLKEFHL